MRVELACLLVISLVASTARAAILQSDTIRLEIGEDAKLISLKASCSERELGRPGEPMAYVVVEGETVHADAATADDASIELTFGETGVSATLEWQAQGALLLVKPASVTGAPTELCFLRLGIVTGGEHLCSGRVHAFEDASIALIPEAPECLVKSRGRNHPYMAASLFSEVSLEPVRIALMAAPHETVSDLIAQAEALFGIPIGIKSKRSEAAMGTYAMVSGMTEENADQVIEWMARAGIGTVMMVHGTWGHFGHHYAVPESTFPSGIEGLRAAVDKIHDRGMLAAAHLFATKVPKTSDYMKPKAERRLYEDLSLTLKEPLGLEEDRIVTTEAPTEWPVTTGTRDIRIGDEMMAYTELSLEQPFGFTGVKRAQCGTEPHAHQAGEQVAHVKTDESRGIFIIDQTTDLIDEHTADIARTYDAAGFDWIYFDGAEDVHPPRWYRYTVPKLKLIEKLEREPVIIQAAAQGPFCWHLTTRVGQRDYFWVSMSYKDEVDDAIARSVPRARRNLMVPELGWFPFRPTAEHIRATQVDDVEYLCAKALASNSTYSIQARPERLRKLPNLDAILHLMGRYEHHKFAGTLADEVKQRVLEPHQDFILLEHEGMEPRLVRAREMPYVAGTSHVVRAFVCDPIDGVRTTSLFPVGPKASIEFSLDPRKLEFTDYQGDPIQVEVKPGARVVVPVTTRVFMRSKDIGMGEIRMALRRAKVELLKPQMILVNAPDAARIEGSFATGAEAGVTFDGSVGDVIVPSGPLNKDTGRNTYVEYELDAPQAGSWLLWIRTRYHDTNSNSFFLHDFENPDEPRLLGNKIGDYHRWLWEGGLQVELEEGTNVIRITGRESRPNESPVLDVICLIYEDFAYRPTDADAHEALGE